MTVGREVGELAFPEAGLTDRGLAWAREERGRHLTSGGLVCVRGGQARERATGRGREGGSGQKAAVLHTAPPGPWGPSSGEF